MIENEEKKLETLVKGRDPYQAGVVLRVFFDYVDSVYKTLLELYKYYHSEVKPFATDAEGNVDEEFVNEKLFSYLLNEKKYDGDLAGDVLRTVLKNDLLECDYEVYKRLLYEVKETYKADLLRQIDLAIRSNELFVEGFIKSSENPFDPPFAEDVD